MTDRERLINARKEARRYKRKYLSVEQILDQINTAMYISGLDYEERCNEVWKILSERKDCQ